MVMYVTEFVSRVKMSKIINISICMLAIIVKQVFRPYIIILLYEEINIKGNDKSYS